MSADVISGSPFTEHSVFTEHSIESAPPAARRFLAATRDHLGYLPAGMARMAASPQIIDGFLKLNAIFESTGLEPLAREVVVMTVATRNRCHICVAMHTAMLAAHGASAELIKALRDPDRAEPLPDERLDAIRVFTRRVLDTAGDVGDQALRDFLAAGYTTQNALEVVLGIGTYTMSTLANRLTGAPVDDQLAAYAWALSCSMTQIDGDAVMLRPLGPGDQDEFVAQARASVKLHHPWYSMPWPGRPAGVPQGGLCARHAVHRRRLAGPRAVGHHPRDDRFPSGRPAPHPSRMLTASTGAHTAWMIANGACSSGGGAGGAAEPLAHSRDRAISGRPSLHTT
jgi:AhpD family alkylhydroperoxidase